MEVQRPAPLGEEPRSNVWERTSPPPPLTWAVGGNATQLEVGRVPRPAWPIVAGALARACAALRRSVLILVPAPERFADELRPWLAGLPSVHVFSEVGISFLDRPPALDESVNKRLEALAALARSGEEPTVVVSSRRAMTRRPSPRETLRTETLCLLTAKDPPGRGAFRLVELGYSREARSKIAAVSLRGGILDVVPTAADSPGPSRMGRRRDRKLFAFSIPKTNARSWRFRGIDRTGRELLIGPGRGAAAVASCANGPSLTACGRCPIGMGGNWRP